MNNVNEGLRGACTFGDLRFGELGLGISKTPFAGTP